MLNNKKFNIVLSILIAALLWVYVVGEVQPNVTKQLRGVPITMTRSDMLAERGLAIGGVSTDSMDVEITGSVLALNEIDSSDVTASVDVGAALKGENEMTVIVRVPSGITVTDKSLNKITVAVEPLVTKTMDVNVVYAGTFPAGDEAETLSVSLSQVDVSGAESMMNVVSSVRATVDAGRVGDEESEVVCDLQALNKDGNPVNDVSISQENVTIKSIIRRSKTVALEVPVVDNSNGDTVHETVIPERVTLEGRADVLNSIETITAKAVDISDITGVEELDIEIDLPDGVELSEESGELKLGVSTVSYATKAFSFAPAEIEIIGAKPGLEYTVEEGQVVTVTLRDNAEVINSILKNKISLTADVSTLTNSDEDQQNIQAQQAKLTASCDEKNMEITLSQETINVTVTSAQE